MGTDWPHFVHSTPSEQLKHTEQKNNYSPNTRLTKHFLQIIAFILAPDKFTSKSISFSHWILCKQHLETKHYLDHLRKTDAMSCISFILPAENSLDLQSNISGSWNTCILSGQYKVYVLQQWSTSFLVQRVKNVFALPCTPQCHCWRGKFGSINLGINPCHTSPSLEGRCTCTASPWTKGYQSQMSNVMLQV